MDAPDAPLRVLSAGSIRTAVGRVAALYAEAGGTLPDVEFTSAPKVRDRLLAGEYADVVIASSAALDALAVHSLIVGCTRTTVGSTGMAIVVAARTCVPDLSTEQAFATAMRAADTVIHNQGSSGMHAAVVLDRIGLGGPAGPKVCVAENGAALFALLEVLPGKVYGLANTTNIADQLAKGAALKQVAPLPGSLQTSTCYEAAASAGSSHPGRAASFTHLFSARQARQRIAAAGLQQDFELAGCRPGEVG